MSHMQAGETLGRDNGQVRRFMTAPDVGPARGRAAPSGWHAELAAKRRPQIGGDPPKVIGDL
jgi:hypothetical protein